MSENSSTPQRPEGLPQLIDIKRRARPRLAELRRVLAEELPQILNGHKFDMGSWVKRAETWAPMDEKSEPPMSCNTAACAAGWGTLSPKLRKLGLRFEFRSFMGRKIWILFSEGDPIFQLRDLFGLTYEGAKYLFTPSGPQPEDSWDDDYPFEFENEKGEEGRLEAISRIDIALAEAAA